MTLGMQDSKATPQGEQDGNRVYVALANRVPCGRPAGGQESRIYRIRQQSLTMTTIRQWSQRLSKSPGVDGCR